ncbi:MAG: phosphoribosylanthranilate isomerase [Desulfotignum sp.]|nr:phosphoribosylanthranilate isomerase [Desulfotignum sp.]MCF8087332.1 phosphoribosylanthranilate isomerase [Desulfotignum sp.]MCF8136736.1 phosphoribosylanthranilate isomerase [Desulfotignum sp.]
MTDRNPKSQHPKSGTLVKICGLTDPDNAAACASAGADIIGLVFYPKSPRHVEPSRAKAVVHALPAHIPAWGVFVNEDPDVILATVRACGLKGVQLHGQEAPGLITALQSQHLTVTKAVFASRTPGIETINTGYQAADFFLVECGQGTLPGGNAKSWDYRQVRKTACDHPVILAGGLSCDNIDQALAEADPTGVDVSSGVECSPGIKDVVLAAEFIRRVKNKKT